MLTLFIGGFTVKDCTRLLKNARILIGNLKCIFTIIFVIIEQCERGNFVMIIKAIRAETWTP